ncbi:MAG TPA: 4-hydroxybenzoate 3-monooxygenase [Vicinamibacterales bacterium]|nr:4-hydroxybenzoate 3-monooxygenase [Vicinamibacterales bacterium]
MAVHKTQVGIVGAGPAGLLLGHLLHLNGIDSVILENRARDYVIDRVRAGVLEQGTVDLLRAMGVSEGLDSRGLRHDGLYISVQRQRHRIDLADLTGGRAITVYGQNEVVKDLIDARVASGRPLYFEAEDVSVEGLDSSPAIRFRHDGAEHEVKCDVIAGCDGFHGICRQSIPAGALTIYERNYPFGWLGILAEVAPSSEELVYAHHERGFALFSMRSPTVTRLYLQVPPDESIDSWSDDAIWDEMLTRMTASDGWKPNVGRIVQKGVTPMRSFVAAPMRHGRLFLAGDAAHIVPPTGAKGLNLAASDVLVLARALKVFYERGQMRELDQYSDVCLRRVWKAQRFSWWMTSTLHRFPDDGPFDLQRQIADLDYLTSSRAAMTSLAEQYVGLPPEVSFESAGLSGGL